MNLFGRPKTIGLTDANYEGVSGAYARADHSHGLSAAFLALLARIGVSTPTTTTSTSTTTVVGQSEYLPPFFVTSTLAVLTGLAPLDIEHNCQIVGVRASVGVAPVGADAIFDLLVNGVSIFTTLARRPTVVAGTLTSGQVIPDVRTLVKGDRLTANVVQVGSTTPGSWLTLATEVQR